MRAAEISSAGKNAGETTVNLRFFYPPQTESKIKINLKKNIPTTLDS